MQQNREFRDRPIYLYNNLYHKCGPLKDHHLTLWRKIKIDPDLIYIGDLRWIKDLNIKGKLLSSFEAREVKVLLIKTENIQNNKAKILMQLFTSKLRISAKKKQIP